MAELTHDAADDGFHEIQLSGKQLAFLVMMTLSGLVLTFLLGVQVGRGVRAERGEDPIDAAPAASTAAADTGSTPSEPPAPPSEAPQLTYPDRLKGEKASESLTPRPEEAAKPEQARPEPPQPEPAPAAATSTATPPPAAPAAAARKPEPAATSVPKVPTSGKAGRWVVQVISLKNGAGAAEITQRLIAKGYPAFMLPPTGTPALYRVQIGRYNDRNEADRIARQLERQEDFRPEVKR